MTRRPRTALLAAAGLVWMLRVTTPAAGDTMALVSAGAFVMGTAERPPDCPQTPPGTSPLHPGEVFLVRPYPAWSGAEERPQRTVFLMGYLIDRHEVTNAEYARFLQDVGGAGGHRRCHPDEPPGKDHTPRYWREFNPLLRNAGYARLAPFGPDSFRDPAKPVVGVDWFDAWAYAAWAGKRLPTEAEWERAARGVDGRRWPWGNDWKWGLANIGGNRHGDDVALAPGSDGDRHVYAAPPGSYPGGRSPEGCEDMAGNVAEWCADWYAPDAYSTTPERDPVGPAAGTHRVIRGGDSRSSPSSVRCAARSHRSPTYRDFALGFRCARDVR